MSRPNNRSLAPRQYEKEKAVIARVREILRARGYFGPASVLLWLSYTTPSIVLNFNQYFNLKRGLEREIMEHRWAVMSREIARIENQEGVVFSENFFLVSTHRICFDNHAPARMYITMWLPDSGNELRGTMAIELAKSFNDFIRLVFPRP